MRKTNISWTEYSWKPITGCKHGCPYCYVRRFDPVMKPTFHANRLYEPQAIKKPSLIFAVNTGDMFGEWVPEKWINDVLKVIRETPRHTFQLLTKNPSRMQAFDMPDNVWAGTTVTKQEDTYKISMLRRVNAKIRFISFEPIKCFVRYDAWNGIDWAIIGAETEINESTPKCELTSKCFAKPLIQSLEKAGVPMFIKPNLRWYRIIQEYPKVATDLFGELMVGS